jgi:hypothetical protein
LHVAPKRGVRFEHFYELFRHAVIVLSPPSPRVRCYWPAPAPLQFSLWLA